MEYNIKKIIIDRFILDKKNLTQSWEESSKQVGTKFLVVDDLISEELCLKIYNAFPKEEKNFLQINSFREKKQTSAKIHDYEKILSEITYAIQDNEFINIISNITDIDKLESDPALYAGGLSMMGKGDYLNPHIDNSHDKDRKIYRRLNLLFYVTPNWELNNGGNFELWNKAVTKKNTIISKFNRLVIMETNKTSWHSVSEVKVDNIRCCVSSYFYTQISPDSSNYFHVTSFTGRPNEKIKRVYGYIDNLMRNSFSKITGLGRNKKHINK